MDALTVFSLFAVTAMLVFYPFEDQKPVLQRGAADPDNPFNL